MSADDNLIQRWKANTSAAGIPLTDDDIARIDARGQVERIRTVEAIVQRANAREVVPDYLAILVAQPSTPDGRRSDG